MISDGREQAAAPQQLKGSGTPLETLRTSLGTWRDTIVETAVAEAALDASRASWEFEQALRVLDDLGHGVAVGPRMPGTDTVAILLPYNSAVAVPIVLAASAAVASRQVAMRLPTEFPRTSRLVGDLLEEALPGMRVAQESGRQFILRHLRRAETSVLLVFGDDQWAAGYEDLVRRCDRKKFIFEGPGKDPFIVLENADLEQASHDAVRGALLNAGQASLCPKRFYVVSAVATEFTRLLLRALRIRQGEESGAAGNGRIGIVKVGVVRRLQAQLDDALARGAKLRCGGGIVPRPGGPGHLVEPTVLTGVNHAMSIMRDETLGPLLPIRVVADAEEAAAMAEDSRYGLAASVYGDAPGLVRRLGRSHGMVCENGLAIDQYKPEVGVGGFKGSGWVWERSDENFCRREGRRRPYYVEFQKVGDEMQA